MTRHPASTIVRGIELEVLGVVLRLLAIRRLVRI